MLLLVCRSVLKNRWPYYNPTVRPRELLIRLPPRIWRERSHD